MECQLSAHLRQAEVSDRLAVMLLTPEPAGRWEKIKFRYLLWRWPAKLREYFVELAVADQTLESMGNVGEFTHGPNAPICATDWAQMLSELRIIAYTQGKVPEAHILKLYRDMRNEWLEDM